jgi:hypothetical protein
LFNDLKDTSYNFLQMAVNELRKLIGIENEGYNNVLFGGKLNY